MGWSLNRLGHHTTERCASTSDAISAQATYSAMLYTALLLLHLLAAIVWLGGMAFVHFALRPAAETILEPPQRVPLMVAALRRFFIMAAA
jgi:uncharacterized membrane protein